MQLPFKGLSLLDIFDILSRNYYLIACTVIYMACTCLLQTLIPWILCYFLQTTRCAGQDPAYATLHTQLPNSLLRVAPLTATAASCSIKRYLSEAEEYSTEISQEIMPDTVEQAPDQWHEYSECYALLMNALTERPIGAALESRARALLSLPSTDSVAAAWVRKLVVLLLVHGRGDIVDPARMSTVLRSLTAADAQLFITLALDYGRSMSLVAYIAAIIDSIDTTAATVLFNAASAQNLKDSQTRLSIRKELWASFTTYQAIDLPGTRNVYWCVVLLQTALHHGAFPYFGADVSKLLYACKCHDAIAASTWRNIILMVTCSMHLPDHTIATLPSKRAHSRTESYESSSAIMLNRLVQYICILQEVPLRHLEYAAQHVFRHVYPGLIKAAADKQHYWPHLLISALLSRWLLRCSATPVLFEQLLKILADTACSGIARFVVVHRQAYRKVSVIMERRQFCRPKSIFCAYCFASTSWHTTAVLLMHSLIMAQSSMRSNNVPVWFQSDQCVAAMLRVCLSSAQASPETNSQTVSASPTCLTQAVLANLSKEELIAQFWALELSALAASRPCRFKPVRCDKPDCSCLRFYPELDLNLDCKSNISVYLENNLHILNQFFEIPAQQAALEKCFSNSPNVWEALPNLWEIAYARIHNRNMASFLPSQMMRLLTLHLTERTFMFSVIIRLSNFILSIPAVQNAVQTIANSEIVSFGFTRLIHLLRLSPSYDIALDCLRLLDTWPWPRLDNPLPSQCSFCSSVRLAIQQLQREGLTADKFIHAMVQRLNIKLQQYAGHYTNDPGAPGEYLVLLVTPASTPVASATTTAYSFES